MTAADPTRPAAGDDDIAWGSEPTPKLSESEVRLRKAIAAPPVKAPTRPLSRRAAVVWGR